MKAEKIIKQFPVNYDLQWTYGVSIADIRRDLDIIEAMGATHVDIESYESYGSVTININVKAEREETDEEFRERLESEERNRKRREEQELAQLETLMAKYPQPPSK
jgi:hypothetical protein